MNYKISLTGNSILTRANEISSICKPLTRYLDIPFFRYARIFNDGSKFILCNKPDLMRFLYEEGHYTNTWYDCGKPASEFNHGCHLWAIDNLSTDQKENQLRHEIIKNFNYTDGIFYCFKQKDCVELFDFININPTIYSIKKELLHRFIRYFKESAKKIIATAENEKFFTQPFNKKTHHRSTNINETAFINTTSTQPSCLDNHFKNIPLSNREKEILTYLPLGKTAKQIASIVNVSHRTIDRHLENIRIKTGLRTKSELIEKLLLHIIY